jgi:NADH:ubiquinone oxidoreductase subunit E
MDQTFDPTFNITPILAGAGAIGLAVGFGAQNLIKDVITVRVSGIAEWENGEHSTMNVEERNYLVLEKFIERYGKKPGGLMRVLQKAQELFGYLSPEVQTYVAEKMCLPVGHVHGVATFYSQFVTAPQGKYVISVCMGTACYVKNAPDILNRFREVLQVEPDETTEDGLFTLRTTRCVGACSMAPLLTVNQAVHGHLEPEDVPRILSRYGGKAGEEVDEVDQELPRPAGDQRPAPPPG